MPFCKVRRVPRTEPLGTLTLNGWAEEAESILQTEQELLERDGGKKSAVSQKPEQGNTKREGGATKWGKN